MSGYVACCCMLLHSKTTSILQQFNSFPNEIVMTKDRSGAPFNFLTNPCIDDFSSDGACGWYFDDKGNTIPYSQGFCCKCDFDDYLGSSSQARGALDCDLFSSANSQSAHCLRWGPLWYRYSDIEAQFNALHYVEALPSSVLFPFELPWLTSILRWK